MLLLCTVYYTMFILYTIHCPYYTISHPMHNMVTILQSVVYGLVCSLQSMIYGEKRCILASYGCLHLHTAYVASGCFWLLPVSGSSPGFSFGLTPSILGYIFCLICSEDLRFGV